MKKPINKFAVALWVFAMLVVVTNITSYVSIVSTLEGFATGDAKFYDLGGGLWQILQGGVVLAVQLVSLGVIIELIDQIRWNALHKTR